MLVGKCWKEGRETHCFLGGCLSVLLTWDGWWDSPVIFDKSSCSLCLFLLCVTCLPPSSFLWDYCRVHFNIQWMIFFWEAACLCSALISVQKERVSRCPWTCPFFPDSKATTLVWWSARPDLLPQQNPLGWFRTMSYQVHLKDPEFWAG